MSDLSAHRAITLPLSLDTWIRLEGRFPVTDAEWAQLLATLDAMRPALVQPAEDAALAAPTGAAGA